jgi:4-amino-4-deoxy-L-arabinose transferase-like glycosyltransferase
MKDSVSLDKKISTTGRSDVAIWASVVLVIAIIVRVLLWFIYQPIIYSDTPSYRRLAQSVLNLFQRYDGTRTPGYPIFLAIFQTDESTWLAQMLLGVAITMLLFYLGWQLSGKAWFGGLVALAHTFNLGQLFFEANLLTETLTTFWITLTLAGLMLWLRHPKRRSLWLVAGLGVTTSLALITRPLFLYLPFWVLLFLLYDRLSLETVKRTLVFSLPVLATVGGWVGFIQVKYGDWGLTTMSGYHLVQHTGNFFEYVPDEYAELRDTYIEFRDEHILEFGTQTNTIWKAIPAMQKASGLSFYDLSRVLARISIQLIREHPNLYLKNVGEGWVMFWLAPIYWSPEAFHWSGLAPVFRGLIQLERALLIIVNSLFIITSLLAVLMHKRLPIDRGRRLFIWCLLGTIWIASILQTILDHGDNPRFLVPLQSLVVLWVLWVALQIAIKIRLKRKEQTSQTPVA